MFSIRWSLPERPQALGWARPEARSQELALREWREPNYLSHAHCHPLTGMLKSGARAKHGTQAH